MITVVKPDGLWRKNRDAFKDKLLQHSAISTVSYSNGSPGEQSIMASETEIDGIMRSMITFLADADYISLMGMEMAEGNSFSWDRPGEKYDFVSNNLPGRFAGMIINESAVREFDLENPIGKTKYLKSKPQVC